MKNIEVVVLNEAHCNPSGMTRFLAKLTQGGHKINNAKDLLDLYNGCVTTKNDKFTEALMDLPHGTIKRFAPITIAIVGASRRFLAQARTNQVGLDYVSASLQYSDYTKEASFVVPYEITKADHDANNTAYTEMFLNKCEYDKQFYGSMTLAGFDNDTAGYAMNQAMRNILIIQGNHQAWDYFLRLRGCNRNTTETQYVTMKIWEALLSTNDGKVMFGNCGADCMYKGRCREGKMCCGDPIHQTSPQDIIRDKWPLLLENKAANVKIECWADYLEYSNLLPEAVREDINTRTSDWLNAGGKITDPYIINQVNYANRTLEREAIK